MSNTLSADTQAIMAFEANKKSSGVAYLLWFFTGGIGGHRFYLGLTGSAVIQLVLCVFGWLTIVLGIGFLFLGILGLWLLVDLFILGGLVSEYNNKLMTRLNNSAAPKRSSVDDLAQFADLRDKGAITDEEYELKKRQILGSL